MSLPVAVLKRVTKSVKLFLFFFFVFPPTQRSDLEFDFSNPIAA